MRYLFLLFVAVTLVIASCDDEGSITPPLPPPCNDITQCDTCNTYAPLTQFDSLHQMAPRSIYTIAYLRKSPDGKTYYGTCELDGWNDILGHVNNFKYNPIAGKITIIPGSQWVEFSNDGKRYVADSYYDILVVNLDDLSYIVIPQSGAKAPTWSVDDKKIYYQKYHETWSMNADGSDPKLLAENLLYPRQYNDSLLVGTYTDGFWFYNLNTQTKTKCAFDIPKEGQEFFTGHGDWDFSPDRTRALCEVKDYNGVRDETGWYTDGGVYLFDFTTMTAKRILPLQYWTERYRPRWASNSTFFATYFCRKDSAAMTYEFDLNGKTLRQVTFKEQQFYPE